MAFADVKYGCLQMLDGLVSTHPCKCLSRINTPAYCIA
jgi:hypothetical protein